MTDQLTLSELPEETKKLSADQSALMRKKYGHLSVLQGDGDVVAANKGLIDVTRFIKRWDEIYKELYGGVEDAMKNLKKALQEKKTAIDFHKQPYIEMEAMLRKAINDWNRAVSLKQMEEERARQREQARLAEEAKKGDKEAAKALLESEPVKAEPEKKQVRTEKGMTISKKMWTYDVVDKSKMPLDLLIPDDKEIRRLVGTGVREIDGIVIFETESVTVRA